MKYVLFKLMQTRDGRRPSEFAAGTVEFAEDGQTLIECPDLETSRTLTRFFYSDCQVRRPCGTTASLLTYTWESLSPGSLEHFQVQLSRLHTLGIIYKPQP